MKKYSRMEDGHNKQLAKFIEEYVRNRICAILYRENGTTKIGTGSFITKQDEHYLITCEHVFSPASTDKSSVIYNRHWNHSKPFRIVNPIIINKKHDIAIAKLNVPIKNSFDYDSLAAVPRYPKDLAMLVVGFPAELAKSKKPNNVKVSVWKYWTARLPHKNKERSQFSIEYDKDLNNTDITGYHKMPDAPGMSGSPIIVPKEMILGKLWTPGDVQIVGVQNSWNEQSRMNGTRGNWIRSLWV
jgi:hypothetical protein